MAYGAAKHSSLVGTAIPLACIAASTFLLAGRRLGSNHAALTVVPARATAIIHSTTNQLSTFDIDESIPACASDVYLILHDELGGANEHACRGLLIRDDIVVTSRECTESEFTFDFSGLGIVEAVPHDSLNSREEMVSSSLGFLEARTPSHYLFVDWPVRRTPMFLSYRSMPLVNGTGVGTAVVLTCSEEHNVPIAHNFPVDGAMVPLSELAVVVPEDILWEETDIHTARMLKYKRHRWWTRPLLLEEEEKTIKKMLKQHRGPPGSVSLPGAHSNHEGRTGALLLEAIDPRGHRRQACMKNYYTRYIEEVPFSGTHFFDWLDFGKGKFLLEMNDGYKRFSHMRKDEECYKRDFNSKRTHYFEDDERQRYEVHISPSEDGTQLIARYKHNNAPVPDSGDHLEFPHLYMWDLNKTFYVIDEDAWYREKYKERYGRVSHAGLMNGQPALSAGKAYFGKDGAIWGVNYSSGHYRPDIRAAAMMYSFFRQQGWNLTALHWVGRTSWSTDDCKEADWESNQISGFTAVDLNRSCHEMTNSPTWVLKDDV